MYLVISDQEHFFVKNLDKKAIILDLLYEDKIYFMNSKDLKPER